MIESKKNVAESSEEGYDLETAALPAMMVLMLMMILLQVLSFHVISHEFLSVPSQHTYHSLTTLEMSLLVKLT
jgi:hypothetical protein